MVEADWKTGSLPWTLFFKGVLVSDQQKFTLTRSDLSLFIRQGLSATLEHFISFRSYLAEDEAHPTLIPTHSLQG